VSKKQDSKGILIAISGILIVFFLLKIVILLKGKSILSYKIKTFFAPIFTLFSIKTAPGMLKMQEGYFFYQDCSGFVNLSF